MDRVPEKRRADLIAEQLEEQIFDGIFAAGERLDEVRLAARFGVSRTPLREAFRTLQISGLLRQIPRRGVFVQQPGPVELVEMFEVMAELEAACGRFAALRITDRALADLETANALCRDAVRAQDIGLYYDGNEAFHQIIYGESGNSFLAREAQALHRRLKPFRRTQLRLRGRLEESQQEHERIVTALQAGERDGAAEALRRHVAIQGERFSHLISGQGHAAR